ncbi:MAG: glycoside hydrolase family 9 protein [Pseudomonadota bacterium]
MKNLRSRTLALTWQWPHASRWLAPALLSLPLACLQQPPPQAPAAQSAGSPAAAQSSGWNDPPTNGSPGVNPPAVSGHNLIIKESFKDGKSLPWTTSFSQPGDGEASVQNGELCMKITNLGVNRWDAQLRHRDMVIEKGHTYSIMFTMHATQKTRAYTKIGQAGPPYQEYWSQQLDLEPRRQTFKGVFTMQSEDDASPELAFHFGGNMAKITTATTTTTATVPFTVCLDDVHIEDPQFTPKAAVKALPIANVLVNQTGYLPRLAKVATVKSATPAKWELLNAAHAVVASGMTAAAGAGTDAASGEQVSVADFSSFTKEGSGYTLKVGADTSHPFDIASDLYAKLKRQALAYFYHNRSGIELKMPFAGEAQWARPAGHIDVAPNKGDRKVPCVAGSGCTYSLDVSGGWYDAGDHGKYVVNAGISVWTLLNFWERAKHLGGPGALADFGDGKLSVPEKGNGVPDLLDEVRWELDFEMRMQVPVGEKLAGMVHHKVHDKAWTALGLAPHEDPIERLLYPPSTAATLNMAANAAQAARVWHGIDKAYAEKCLTAAERAWRAAEANPAVYAKAGGVGGGPYDDGNVTDEFYWAAAELFLATKKPVYKDFVTKSPFYKQVPANATASGADAGLDTSMTWGNVQALGSISLAVVPNGLSAADVGAIKKNIATTADAFLAIAQAQGYRVPFKPGPKGYPWGSNSFVMNNLVVIGLAHDLTRDAKYLNGVAEGMDYLMGRNPMDQGYVTGYGERALEHPHHRFWSHQANAKFPKAPPGAVSGGPNSGLEDPYVQAAGLKGCAPEKCFVDNIEAWSTNEITINWNAPLAWIAAFLDEKASAKGGGGGAGKGKGKSEK